MQRIRLDGEEYILTAGGAIATQDDYENGRCSFAHLDDDGVIWRFHEEIGHQEDIEIIGEREPKVGLRTLIGVLCDPSWPTDLVENPSDAAFDEQKVSDA